MKNEISFEFDFGEETFGKIEYNPNTEKYECFENPLYGGEYYKIGDDFIDFNDAKLFLLGMI